MGARGNGRYTSPTAGTLTRQIQRNRRAEYPPHLQAVFPNPKPPRNPRLAPAASAVGSGGTQNAGSMINKVSNFELPKNIERFLAALSKIYANNGNRALQELIVNSEIRVHEEWCYDNWNGGTYGHALYLVVPEPLFLSSVSSKIEIQAQIKEDLNKVQNLQNEFIAEVFLEMEVSENHDWRKDSGLLFVGRRGVAPEASRRIWGDGGFRVFLSHKTEAKKETAELKDRLGLYGISCFVAHEDIHPTKAWQDEIENALASMDGFVALMTEDFHDSDWTDQEVGFAFARNIPFIAVRLGKDPYGFIGKFQALSSSWSKACVDIVKILIKNDRIDVTSVI